MTLNTDGHSTPHASRHPTDAPPRRDSTSPAATAPRKRLAMARAILSALSEVDAFGLLLAVMTFARTVRTLARAVTAKELLPGEAARAAASAVDVLYEQADAGHAEYTDAPAPSDLASALVAVWWGDAPATVADSLAAAATAPGYVAATAEQAEEEVSALVMAMREKTGGEGVAAPTTAPARAPVQSTDRADGTPAGAEGEDANPANVYSAAVAAPVVRAIVAGLEPDLRRPLVRAVTRVLAAGSADEKNRATDALDATPCAASGRAILGAYMVDPDDGLPLPLATAGELVSALVSAAEQPPAVRYVNDLPAGCRRVTLADGTTFLPAQPAEQRHEQPAPRVVRVPFPGLDGDATEDTAALLRDVAAYVGRHCGGDLAVATCCAMTAAPGDETVDALAFVACELSREFKHRGRDFRSAVAALASAERHDPADVIARRRAEVDHERDELARAALLVGRVGRALASTVAR